MSKFEHRIVWTGALKWYDNEKNINCTNCDITSLVDSSTGKPEV